MFVAEHISNVDEVLGEMFLEEKKPTVDDVKVISFCKNILFSNFVIL
jgi:hypothetical protein